MKNFVSMLLVILFISASLNVFSQPKSEPYFLSYPAISPDGETIVFAYNGDLWRTPTGGGLALRLTALEGMESRPSISPDGKWIAFTANVYNNEDVFLMPFEGGAISRLTYHQGSDHVDSWAWDSNSIYFTSDRYNLHSGYNISLKGGTPVRVFDDHYFNNSHNLAEHPTTGEVFFNESWESKRFAHRQGYKGPYNPEIKSFHPESQEYKEYTDWVGKDFWHTIDKEGNVYFVSDKENGVYNLYSLSLSDSTSTQLTNFDRPIKRPQVSADGSMIVFEKDYQLYTYNISTETIEKPSISFHPYDVLSITKTESTGGDISAFDVSPDAKKFVFVSRGEVFVSDVGGDYLKHIETTAGGRVVEINWDSDNSFVYNQTVNGHLNLFKKSIDGEETQLTFDDADNRRLSMDSKKENLLYISGRDKLKELNIESANSETLVEDEFWGIYNTQPYYSHDDQRILYTAIRNFERDVFIYEKSTKEAINITKTGVGEFSPVFDPTSKYLYYASDRLNPSFPRGSQDTHIYRLPLAKFSDPFKSEEFDKLFSEEKTKEDSESSEDDFDIDLSNIMERVEQVGPRFGRQASPVSIKDNDKEVVIYVSNHDESNNKLWMTIFEPFKNASTREVQGIQRVNGYELKSSNGKHFLLINGDIYSFNSSAGKVSKITINHRFEINLREEFEQMFEETWSNVVENFYDESLHGYDDDTLKATYKAFIPYLTNREDLRVLVNDLLGEINASHLGFNSNGREERIDTERESASIGVMWKSDSPFEIDRIVRNGVADKVDIDLKPGDALVAVNSKKIDTSLNREQYFEFLTFPQELSLTFRRNDQEFVVRIHPQSTGSFRQLLYDEWKYENEQYVHEKSENKIAYVHMENMSGGALNDFLLRMTATENYEREALILDLRYNRGGNVHDDVLQFLSQKQYFQWKYRDGKMSPQPNFIPGSKPIVLLINEQSLSDAEVTAEGFKTLELGTVVGTETYRWIIFTTSGRLVDGSSYRLPTWGCYTLDGENLEKVGVKPDVYVGQSFKDRFMRNETQLDKSIEQILEELEG